MSKENKSILDATIKKLKQAVVDHHGNVGASTEKYVWGATAKDLTSYVNLIATTDRKEAWGFLLTCLSDERYNMVHGEIAEALSGNLSKFHIPSIRAENKEGAA